jgi:hypothetical protein
VQPEASGIFHDLFKCIRFGDISWLLARFVAGGICNVYTDRVQQRGDDSMGSRHDSYRVMRTDVGDISNAGTTVMSESYE